MEQRTHGTLNEKPVAFVYEQVAESTKRLLAWTDGHNNAPVSDHWNQIQQANLIAVIPVHETIPNNYSILYVEDNPAAKDSAKASPVIFKSAIATSLPQAFVHDFQPLGQSYWTIQQSHPEDTPSTYVIASCSSGTGLAQDVWERLLEPLIRHTAPHPSSKYVLHITTSDQSITELTREVFFPKANAGILLSIVLLSGDGGVVDIINALLAEQRTRQYVKPTIALLPLGTGNALAHSARITGDNTIGLKTMIQGAPKDLPLFCASFSPGARLLVNEGREERELNVINGRPTVYGAVVCSWGLHATLVADSDTAEYRRHGAERFKMAAKEALFPSEASAPHAYKGKVSIVRPSSDTQDEWYEIPNDAHGYVLVTLVSHLERGFNISPASKPLDGKMRLVHFGALSGTEAMEIMGKAYDSGKHVESEKVGYEEIERLRIEFHEEDSRWRRVCIDGKIVRVEEGGWLEVMGGIEGVVDLIAM